MNISSSSAPSAPQNIRGFCNVIVWEEPQRPNGELTSYDIMFYPQNNPSRGATSRLNNPKTFYITSDRDISQGSGSTYVRVSHSISWLCASLDTNVGSYLCMYMYMCIDTCMIK